MGPGGACETKLLLSGPFRSATSWSVCPFGAISLPSHSRFGWLPSRLRPGPGRVGSRFVPRLLRQGEAGETFYLVATGSATVSRGGTRLASLGPGSYFGEIAIVERVPRTATVTADTRSLGHVFVGFVSTRTESPACAPAATMMFVNPSLKSSSSVAAE